MKKTPVLALLGLSLLGLAACGRQMPTPAPSSSTPSTKASTTASSSDAPVPSSSSSSQTQAPERLAVWNEEKTAQLKDYILTNWGPAMGQTYKAYTPATLGTFFGVPIPDGLLTATAVMTPDMNGQSPELFWSMDGLAQSHQLAVVAVYADSEGNRSMSQHLYVFTVNPQGQAQVWITQQNQGNPENKLYFTETKNEALRDFFTQLVGRP